MRRFPEGWVEKWRPKASGGLLFGTPMEDLSRDELLAAVAFLAERERSARADARDRMESMSELMKAVKP